MERKKLFSQIRETVDKIKRGELSVETGLYFIEKDSKKGENIPLRFCDSLPNEHLILFTPKLVTDGVKRDIAELAIDESIRTLVLDTAFRVATTVVVSMLENRDDHRHTEGKS